MTIRNLLIVVFTLFYSFFAGAQNSNYTLINDATPLPGCHCYQLTPDVGNSGGGVYQNNTINLNNSFDYTFKVFLGSNGSNGADGMTFILTPNITGIGAQGGGLGYSGLAGNSLAVEYDTYQNGWDPPYDHIALEYNGQVQHPVGTITGPFPARPGNANMADGNWHTTRIVWNVNAQTYTVYFDGILIFTQSINMVSTYFGGNPIVNWGWSGSTGGRENTQQFCVLSTSNWVSGVNYQSCSTTMQFHDISTSNVANVQSWAWNFGDPGSGASNTSTLQNPSHTFSAPGTYNVTLIITDISGCPDTFTHAVTIAPPISLAETGTQPLCNGGNNGSISLTPSGGFGAGAGYGGYSYTWSNGGSTQSTDVGLTAGTYDVTVTDGVCTTTAQYTLNQPPALTATTSHTDAPCGGTGTATITINGGTPPYSNVTWDGIAGTPGPNTFTTSGLPVGTVVANFVDANGCSSLLTYRENISSLPCGYTVSTSATNVSCFGGSNGSVTVNVTGTVGTAVINWYNAGGTLVGTGATVNNLPAGTYHYVYTDSKPTTLNGSATITQPGGAMAVSLATVDATCSYLTNGSAVASVTANGTPNYSYAWSVAGQSNSPTATGLSPGSITVTVTDQNGCTGTATGTVNGQTPVTGTVTSTPDSCFQSSTGTISVVAAGGVPNYTYQWNSGPTAVGSTVFALGAGTYTVTITDHNSCTATATGTITQPTQLTATIADSNIACFGGASGTATVTAVGGNGGFTYSWSNTATTPTITGLTPNTYRVTVTDSKLCTVVDSVTITQPASALSVVADSTNIKCFGAHTGTITLVISGGSTPYGAVTWSDAGTGTSRTGLASGTYGYTVTDAHHCSVTGSVNLTQPATAFTVAVAQTNVLCFGASTATITLTPSGGTTPYATAQWLDGFVGDIRSNLAANTYFWGDSDHNGCLDTGHVTITQPAAAFTVTPAVTNVLCYGASTGSIVLTEAGGTTPYATVTWRDGATGTTRNNLPAGSYSYIAKDANGCTDSATLTVTQPATAFAVTVDSTNIKCFGLPTGTITLVLSGGTTPYGTVNWSGGATGTSRTGLVAGTYSYTATDANGCSVTGSVNLTQPATAFTVAVAQTNVLCFGASTGTITLTPSGGTTPYATAQWLDGFVGDIRSNLAANTYFWGDSDHNGCLDTGHVTITQPAAAFTVTPTVTNVLCHGASTGSIVLTEAGGTTPYATVTWRDGATGTTRNNLPAGSYSYIAADANGCTDSATLTITQPTAFTVTVDSTNIKCFGLPTGTITLVPSGGTTPYGAVTWSDAGTGTSRTGLLAGTYGYTVADANGCSVTGSVNLTQPATAFTVAVAQTNVLCFGASTGTITLTPSGGTTPYATAQWLDGFVGDIRSNLAANTYFWGDSDHNGCLDTGHVTITQPAAAFTVTPAVTNVLCYGASTGSIVLTEAGGTTPYATVTWRDGATGTTRNNLPAGSYSYIAADANGCTDSATLTITQPTQIAPVVGPITNISCFGANDGSVVVNASGGSGTFTYELDASGVFQASGAFTGLTPGAHTVTVQDGNGCDTTVSFTITQPAVLTLTLTGTINDSCFNACDGSLIVTAGGGTTPYQFSIDGVNYFPSDTFSGLCANPTYTITVKDVNSCTTSTTGSITQPTAVVVAPVDSFPPSCYDGSNASFDVTASGGTGAAYTYSLNGGPYVANGGHFTGVTPGFDTVTAKDVNGCTGTYIINVPNVTATSSYITLDTNVSCAGGSNGSIQVVVTGTVTPYSYSWSSGQSTPYINGLPAGTYIVRVTDGHGCLVFSADSTNIITQPTPVSATYTMTPVTCFGDSNGCITVTPAGGTGPYTNSWSNGAVTNNPCGLKAGAYSDTIRDANNCQYIQAGITVTQPNPVWVTIDSVTTVACAGDSNGAIAISDSGGTPGYTYLWSNGGTTNPLTGLKVGEYYVTVTDANHCTAVDSAAVTVNNPILLNAAKTNVLCVPLSNGHVVLHVSGGSPGYQYLWSNGATTSEVANLAVGIDSVTVTDSRGCSVDTGFVITNDSAFSALAVPDTATINEGDMIQMGVQVTNLGAGNAYYAWSPTIGLTCSDCQAPQASPMVTTTYQVTVTSDSGCIAYTQSIITVIPQHQFYVPNAFTPNNDGINDLWEIFGDKKAWTFVEVEVYDRWGEKIFQSNDMNFQWDGKYRGTFVEPGVYIYALKLVFIDGYSVNNKGSITVIR